ncbi:F-box/kelch-repeat protein At3g06240-like [Lotus japonicus]|uniref:F-box/kelch-repeat protein At3g06240-like n=1 Tax=Lotus japonicus TaxID=34305 RepID=UPI002585C9DA|nr:F-box/kelch-repeat protein At3g06240-like [Lotus japonicus]
MRCRSSPLQPPHYREPCHLAAPSRPPSHHHLQIVDLFKISVGYGIFTDFRSNSYLEVLGSCRGFLLLATRLGSSFTVCNPSTGEHRRIPSTSSFSYSASSLNGIGYDESTDDYLLVSIKSYGCNRTIKLFSLKTNLPRSLTLDLEYRYLDCSRRSDLFLHGSLHWLVTSGATKLPVVLAFNLVGRCLSEIALSPDLALELKNEPCDLREMAGCLGLCPGLCYTAYSGMIEIWIIKEYKVQSSWTKIVFSTHDIHTTPRFFPICFTKCGDIFGSDENGRLLRFNDKGKLLAVWPWESKYRLLYSLPDSPEALLVIATPMKFPHSAYPAGDDNLDLMSALFVLIQQAMII